MADQTKVLIVERNGVDIEREEYELNAENIPFDNTGTDFDSTDVQAAIVEAGSSAAPPYNFGRSGNSSAGTWLEITGGVPSNKAGLRISSGISELVTIYASNENISTYSIKFYEHDGNEINLTLLATLTVNSARGAEASISVSVTPGKQLAAQVDTGSVKNIGVGAFMKGSI